MNTKVSFEIIMCLSWKFMSNRPFARLKIETDVFHHTSYGGQNQNCAASAQVYIYILIVFFGNRNGAKVCIWIDIFQNKIECIYAVPVLECIYIYIHEYIFVYVCVYIYLLICICIYTNAYIYIYSHINIYIFP